MTAATPAPTRHTPPEGCTCPYAWKSLGRLYGISMGHDWVRLDTAPGCPVHSEETR